MIRKIITDPADINKMLRECYKQPYAHKFGNLVEMDQFLER